MTTKHTPGPWVYKEIDSAKVNIRTNIPKYSESVALVYRNLGSPTLNDKVGEGDANARLIESAPELLEALKLVKNNYKHLLNKHAEIIDRAISKAEGKL